MYETCMQSMVPPGQSLWKASANFRVHFYLLPISLKGPKFVDTCKAPCKDLLSWEWVRWLSLGSLWGLQHVKEDFDQWVYSAFYCLWAGHMQMQAAIFLYGPEPTLGLFPALCWFRSKFIKIGNIKKKKVKKNKFHVWDCKNRKGQRDALTPEEDENNHGQWIAIYKDAKCLIKTIWGTLLESLGFG